MDPEEEAALEAEARLAAATGAEGETPPAEPPAEGETPPAEPPAEGETPPSEPPVSEPPPTPRGSRTFEARIGELSADKRRLREENARLQAELARVWGSAPPATTEGETPPVEPPAEGETPPQRHNFASQEEFQRAVQEEARRQAEVAAFNARCNAVEDAGLALGEDRWKSAKRNLGLLDDEGRIPYEILSVALETDKPEQVLLALGEDPDRAAELLRMTPTKRALEIAKMSTASKTPSAPTPPPRSEAPDPVEPIRGRGAAPDRDAPSDQDDDATWLRKRNADLQRKAIKRAELERSLG